MKAARLGIVACAVTRRSPEFRVGRDYGDIETYLRDGLKLAANERIAGFIYIGTATEQQPDRDRPQLANIVTRWTG